MAIIDVRQTHTSLEDPFCRTHVCDEHVDERTVNGILPLVQVV